MTGLVYGSVCSGIEAATVAWHPLGWRPAWFAEIDTFPSAVLAHRFPEVPNHGDFTGITAAVGTGIDLLVGGTPCQSFSLAGLRGGLADERGNLALEFLRLADRCAPRWIVWENVPGVLSSNGGRDFGSFVGALAELGYGWAYRVLDAQYFGVPQRRRRVFVVGCLGDWRGAGSVLFEPPGMSGHSPSSQCARSQAAGGAAVCVRGSVTHTLTAEGFDASEDGTGRGTPIVARTPTAHPGGRYDADTETFVVEGVAKPLTASPGGACPQKHTLIPFDTTQITSPQNRARPVAGAPSHPLTAHGHPPAVAFHHQQDPVSGPVSPCLSQGTAGMGVHASGLVRRLTPRECERLQGFPDDWTAIPGAKDSPRYKAIGNSMAVPVMRWIGERIQFCDAMRRAA